jgi:branched-chain amino acid aminotransferase
VKIFWDGKIQDAAKAKVQVHQFQGDGLAEAMKVVGGKPEYLKEHLERLAEGAKVLIFSKPNLDGIKKALQATIAANRLKDGSLRLRWFGGQKPARLLVLAFKADSFNPRKTTKPLRLFTTSTRHYGPSSLQGRLKANSMLPNLLTQWEAQIWADDGLRLTGHGLVAEGSWNNILCAKKGILYTPPLSIGILEGTTRQIFIADWKRKGGEVKEVPLTRYDFYTADQIWICSAIKGPMIVGEVDGRKVGKN